MSEQEARVIAGGFLFMLTLATISLVQSGAFQAIYNLIR